MKNTLNKINRMTALEEERSQLTEKLRLALIFQDFMPDLYDGECVKVSTGFKFSKDGERYSRNSFNRRDLVENRAAYFKYSIAVISRKDVDGNVIEEIEIPANTLPVEHLPEFWKELTNNKQTQTQ